MKEGLKTAASIALATTCVATAPLRSEAGETPNVATAFASVDQPSFDSNASNSPQKSAASVQLTANVGKLWSNRKGKKDVMTKGERIASSIIDRICTSLKCDVGDIMEVVPDKNAEDVP